MKNFITGIALLLFLICLSETTFAQIKGVDIGDSVRVTAKSISDNTITGKVLSITSKIILISKDYSQNDSQEIPIEAIDELEMQREIRKTGRGALVGAGVGGITSGLLAMATNEPCEPGEWCIIEFTPGEAFLLGAAFGVVTGGVIGAIIGTTVKEKKWKNIPVEVSIEPISFKYQGQQGIAGITLNWSF